MRHFPLFLLLLLSTSLAAQAYQPFIQDNHRWMVSWDFDNTLWDFDDFYENVFGADTLINDTSYTMVWRNYYARTGEPGGFETIIQPFEPGFQDELIGFVREDTSLQRVYYRSEGAWIGDQEFMLYDFNLEVGDMVFDSLVGAGPYQVVQIDTLFSHGAFRQIWSLDDGQTITEGIGSSFGPFEGITNLISGGIPQLYQFCNGPAMDCHVAVDGMVNNQSLYNISIFSFGISSPNFSILTFEYRFLDTIHQNGHVYFPFSTRQEQDAPEFMRSPYSAFRQDAREVYYLDTYTGEEFLAYNFGLEVGDTISYPTPFGLSGNILLTVEEVDSIMLLNGELRKRLRLAIEADETWGFDNLTWVEGIGEIHYPFDPYYRIIPPIDGPEISLQCYYTDYEYTDQADYLAPDQSECYTYIVNNEEIIEGATFLLHPNPAGDVIFWPEAFHNHHLLLYNSLGQNCGSYSMASGSVDISALQPGTYYYQVLDKDGQQSAVGKLIKL